MGEGVPQSITLTPRPSCNKSRLDCVIHSHRFAHTTVCSSCNRSCLHCMIQLHGFSVWPLVHSHVISLTHSSIPWKRNGQEWHRKAPDSNMDLKSFSPLCVYSSNSRRGCFILSWMILKYTSSVVFPDLKGSKSFCGIPGSQIILMQVFGSTTWVFMM